MLRPLQVVKEAEAEAEAKFLQGAGVARQRQVWMGFVLVGAYTAVLVQCCLVLMVDHHTCCRQLTLAGKWLNQYWPELLSLLN
jgi:hypothetical protein